MNDILRPPRHFRNVPRSGSDQPKAEWQATMRALLLVAEHDDPAMFARIDVIRALNSHFEPVFDPSRKDTRWGPRRLRIDDGSKQVWRDVSRSAAHLPAALPAAHSRELRPSALVADKPWHPRQAVPSLAQASSDIRGILRGRRGITNMFGRFKRRLRALMTPGKPTVGKFLQAFERGFLVLPELDAYRRVGLQSSRRLQDV